MPNFHRRSIRLKDWDYSQPGAYFVTLVAQNRASLFGEIINNEMQLNPAGQMLAAEWNALPSRFPMLELDEWIIMPNYFHGIVVLNTPNVGAGFPVVWDPVGVVALDDPMLGRAGTPTGPLWGEPAPTQASAAEPDSEVAGIPMLGEIIGAFKSLTTGAYIQNVKLKIGRASTKGYGSEIFTNTLFVMTATLMPFVPTLRTTPSNGHWKAKTQ